MDVGLAAGAGTFGGRVLGKVPVVRSDSRGVTPLFLRRAMTHAESILGYCGFELFQECYAYDEDSCYIADSEAAAHRFMEYASFGLEYRIEPVTLARIMDDFGRSLGRFTMERPAFVRFRAAAEAAGIRYQSHAIQDIASVPSADLVAVYIDNVARHGDDD